MVKKSKGGACGQLQTIVGEAGETVTVVGKQVGENRRITTTTVGTTIAPVEQVSLLI